MRSKSPLNITVMLGGTSEEREVSLRSGRAMVTALRSLGHRVSEVDPIDPSWTIAPETDVVALALHGTFGEDGTVQQILEEKGFTYTGCDSESSRVAFDKVLAKECFKKHGVPTPREIVIRDARARFPAGWKPPLILKPVRQGSSVGLHFVDRIEDWPAALAGSIQFGGEVLVEQRVIGRETTVGILDGMPLPVVEVRPKTGGYDYTNKYTSGATEYFCPADFDTLTTQQIQGAASGAFRSVGGRDYARVDVMVTESGKPLVLEVNTLPGMTETSLLPKAAAAAGYSFPALCQKMIEMALNRRMQTAG